MGDAASERRPVWRVLRAALLSRAAVLSLAFLADALLADYDSSSRYDVPDTATRCELTDGDEKFPQKTVLLQAFCKSVQGVLSWDSLHFLRVAQCGYETEKSHAFFPLLPALMRATQATLLRSLLPHLSPRCTLALAGLLISNTCFVLAALALYWLGCVTLRDGDLAERAVLLFCWNPASIFYSSVYSESLFALLSFSGALSLAIDNPWSATMSFMAASAARSNGAVNSLLLGWDGARRVAHAARSAHTLRERLGCVALAVGCALRCAVAVSPFLLLQLWAWLRFCADGEGRPWCRSMPPFVYSFVQREYWGLGPLSFWRREQAPNFALAAPVLLLTACGVVCAVRGARSRQSELEEAQRGARPRELLLAEQQAGERAEIQRRRAAAGELIPFGSPVAAAEGRAGGEAGMVGLHRRKGGDAVAGGRDVDQDACELPALVLGARPAGATALRANALSEPAFVPGGTGCGFAGSVAVRPHVALWALLAVAAAVLMHVQVATRLLSACPALYWYLAHLTGAGPRWAGRLVWAWSLGYAAVGTVLFVAFYPWT